jgi:BON domain-containing protein
MRYLDRLALIGIAVFTVGVFGCGPVARTETTTTTTRYPTATSQLILPSQPSETTTTTTTITSIPDGIVERRTTTTYHYPDIDDALIEEKVRAAIETDPALSSRARSIGVASNGGVVRLSGVVGSMSEVQEASIQASEVPDVRQVDNDLMIGPQPVG